MVRAGKQANKGGKTGDEVGDSQQRLSRSAGVLHVKRKTKMANEPQPENFEGETGGSGADGCPLGILPPMLFSKEEMPGDGRINTHSRIDRLSEIVEILDGTPELEWIKESPLGTSFSLPTRYCEFSGRLVHNLVSRSLITDKKREMWFVFGGKPVRFSLKEFAMITGLNCNPLPSEEERDRLQTPERGDDDYWNYLIGKPQSMTIEGIVRMLKADKKLPQHKRMDPDRRLKLCLIVIVEGILCIRSSVVVATKKRVEMVKNLDTFCNYPWGRESFELTMRMVSIGEKVRTAEALAVKLNQSHFSNHGFTLAFQLLAVYTIPLLEKIIPEKDFDSHFYDPLFTGLARAKPFHNSNILAAEENPELVVESLLTTGHNPDDWDLSWDDEVEDPRVQTILNGLETGYEFKTTDWKVHQLRSVHRNQKTKGPKLEPGKSFAGCPMGESGSLEANSLLTECDRLMDSHLARKHEFEVKELEALREGYKDLLLRALTLSERNSGGLNEERVDEDAIPVYTPARRVRGLSDVESLSESETDSEEQLSRKNRRKMGKGKAKGKRVQADVGGGLVDSSQERRNKRPKETTVGPSILERTDAVGADVRDVVKELDKMYGEGAVAGSPQIIDTEMHAEVIEDGHVVPPNTTPVQAVETNAVVSQDVEMPTAKQDEEVDEKNKMPTSAEEDVREESALPEPTDSPTKAVDSENPPVDLPIPHAVNADSILEPEENVFEDDGDENTAVENETDLIDARDSHVKDVDSVVGTTEVMGVKGPNYCSGAEEDDVVETAPVTKNDELQRVVEQPVVLALRSTRARNAPNRFGQTPEQKPGMPADEEDTYDPLGPVAETKKQLFYRSLDSRKTKELKVLGEDVKKAFFRELCKPKQHLSTAHMESLLSSVWARRGEEMLRNKTGVMDMWFCRYLVQEHGRLCKTRNPPVPFKWHSAIVNYVNGDINNREGSLRWMVDVDQLYAPMNWGGNH